MPRPAQPPGGWRKGAPRPILETRGGKGVAMKLEGVPPLRTLPKVVEARCFNKVRLALVRLGGPLSVEIPYLRIEVTLDRRCWIGRSLINGIPLLAWTEFAVRGRGLHQNVPCALHLYHFHAGLLMGTVLDNLCTELDCRLDRGDRPRGTPDVAWL